VAKREPRDRRVPPETSDDRGSPLGKRAIRAAIAADGGKGTPRGLVLNPIGYSAAAPASGCACERKNSRSSAIHSISSSATFSTGEADPPSKKECRHR
jgi:hypothetical protein